MGRQGRPSILMISIIAFVVSATFAFVFKHSWEPERDDRQYNTIARNLAGGHGFSLSDSKPYAPTMLREPAYPLYLAGIYKVFGYNLAAVVLSQIALFICTSILTYILARAIFGERTAVYSGILCAISPALAGYPGYLLSETLFAFLLCLTAFCFNKMVKSHEPSWTAISGAALAITVLCKSIMILFFLIAVIGIFLVSRHRSQSLGWVVMRLAVFSLVFMLLVGSWSWRNHRIFGTYQISLRGGAALWERADKLNKTWRDMKHEIVFNFSEYLGDKLFPGVAQHPRDIILEGSRMSYYRDLEMQAKGMAPLEIDKAMRKEAVQKIRAHPIKFLAYIPIELIKMSAFMYVPLLNETSVIERFHKIRYGDIILSSIRGAIRLSAYPILILAIAGIIFTRRLWQRWYLLIGAIIYVNMIYSLLFAMGRYAVGLIPFYSIFAAAGFAALTERRKGMF